MDPCRFVRIVVGKLAIKFPAAAAKRSLSAVHPDATPCFCRIKLHNFPTQTATVPLLQPDHRLLPDHQLQTPTAAFNLTNLEAKKLAAANPRLRVSVYTGSPAATCGFASSAKLLGRVSVALNLNSVEFPPASSSSSSSSNTNNNKLNNVFHAGWVSIGGARKTASSAQFHLNVRAEPDPRFVFRFGGEPECSPQVFQIQGNNKKQQQPVFTCKFGFRTSLIRNRSSLPELRHSKSWLGTEKPQTARERKGWSVTVHDLSGSPVAAASMVTPFVPSPGSDRVSRSNPGAWLILRPCGGAWNPWGRLEAWREPSCCGDSLSYRFQLLHEAGSGITLASSTLSAGKGGKFTIDDMTATAAGTSPLLSPSGSFDLGSGSWSGSSFGSGSGSWTHGGYRGFVMSSTAGSSGRPEVEVGVEHVACAEDAAAFVALAAAVDLSVDACRLFSQKLRKELRNEAVV